MLTIPGKCKGKQIVTLHLSWFIDKKPERHLLY